MILFFRKIPADTHSSELKGYVMPALEGGLFSQTGRILRAEIIIMHDKTTQELQYHGLVHVDSDNAGLRAIKKLKGKLFKNNNVLVREYVNRSGKNDPRTHQKIIPKEIIEKRIQDRRLVSNLEVVNDYPRVFSPDFNIARRFG